VNCAKVRPKTDQPENCSNLIKKKRKTAATLADNWEPSAAARQRAIDMDMDMET